jgi:hypothetical protein
MSELREMASERALLSLTAAVAERASTLILPRKRERGQEKQSS